MEKEDITNSKDFVRFKILLRKLTKLYDISGFELVAKAQEQNVVPVTIFSKNLSPLECVVKYMRENMRLDNNKAAELLNRSGKTVWQAYSSANRKLSAKIEVKSTVYFIPIKFFADRRLSVLEWVVKHLVEEFKLRYCEIADLIYRDDRTVWTVYSRAKEKLK